MIMNKQRILILFLLLILLSAMRIVHLGADPPHDLSRSMGYMSDPGGYVFNARNRAVFGQWEMDMWNLRHISPLPHYITYVIFHFFGPGTAQMNVVPAIFSILLLLVTFFIFRKEETAGIAFLALLLLGINYQFTMFSRIAVRVMPMLFFFLLAVFFIQKSLADKKYGWMAAAGVSAFISFTVKATFFQILPALLIGLGFFLFFRFAPELKKMLAPLGFFLLGFIAAAAGWMGLFYLPHRDMFKAYGGENIAWLTPNSLDEIIKNFWSRPLYYLNETPVLFCLACIFIIILIYRAFTSPKKITLLEWISGLWLISNLIYYSMIFYHAARHFVVLMVPVVFLAAGLLRDIMRARKAGGPRPPIWLFYLFLFGWMIFPLSNAMIYFGRPVTLAAMRKATIQLFLLDAAVCALFFIGIKVRSNRKKLKVHRLVPVLTAVLLISVSGWVNLKPYFRWAIHPFYRIQTISRDLGRTYDYMVLAGLVTPVISLENRFEVHPYRSGYINPYPDFMQKFGITHIFPTLHANAIEKIEYFRDFPEALQRSRVLARYPLWQTYAELIALNPSAMNLPLGNQAYEGETFFGKPAMPRFDEKASQKTALAIPNDRGEILAELPLNAFPAGNYQIRFFLKTEEIIPASAFVSKIDVVDRKRRKLLTYRNLTGADFPVINEYTAFDMSLDLPRPAELSLRVYSPGDYSLRFDRVIIQSL